MEVRSRTWSSKSWCMSYSGAAWSRLVERFPGLRRRFCSCLSFGWKRPVCWCPRRFAHAFCSRWSTLRQGKNKRGRSGPSFRDLCRIRSVRHPVLWCSTPYRCRQRVCQKQQARQYFREWGGRGWLGGLDRWKVVSESQTYKVFDIYLF